MTTINPVEVFERFVAAIGNHDVPAVAKPPLINPTTFL